MVLYIAQIVQYCTEAPVARAQTRAHDAARACSNAGSAACMGVYRRGRAARTAPALGHEEGRSRDFLTPEKKRGRDAMSTILLVVLILLLIGALPTYPYSRSWGYYPSGGIGLVLVILLILMLLGRL